MWVLTQQEEFVNITEAKSIRFERNSDAHFDLVARFENGDNVAILSLAADDSAEAQSLKIYRALGEGLQTGFFDGPAAISSLARAHVPPALR